MLKAVSATLAHKTEVGAVRLNLRDATVREAAGALAASAPLLVERMQEGAVAELIIGVTRDPQFGPTLTIGAGGFSSNFSPT